MKLFAIMNSKFDHPVMDVQASGPDSPHSSHHSSDVSLSSPARSDTPHSDDMSINDHARDDHIHNGQLKSQSSISSLITECKPSNKLSFGISRLLSSKTSDSKCIDNHQALKVNPNHQQDSLEVNESNKLKVDSLLSKSDKSNDSDLRVPVQQYHSSPLGYHNPFSWLSPQVTSPFIPKDRLSVSLPLGTELPAFGHRRMGHPYQNRTPPKRKKPRTSFTRGQINELEKRFQKQKYLASSERVTLAKHLKMTDAQVKTWFQNRRTKWRRQTAEEQEAEMQTANRLMISMQAEANKGCIYNGTLPVELRNSSNESLLSHSELYGSLAARDGFCSSNNASIYPYSNIYSWISSNGRDIHRPPAQALNGERHSYLSPLTLTSMLC